MQFDHKHFENLYFSVAHPYLKYQPQTRIVIGLNLSNYFSQALLNIIMLPNTRLTYHSYLTQLSSGQTHLAHLLDVAFFRPLAAVYFFMLQRSVTLWIFFSQLTASPVTFVFRFLSDVQIIYYPFMFNRALLKKFFYPATLDIRAL